MTRMFWVWRGRQAGPAHCCFICIIRGGMQASVLCPGWNCGLICRYTHPTTNFCARILLSHVLQAEAETKDGSPAGKRKSPEKAEEVVAEEAAAKKQKTPPKEDEAAVVEEAFAKKQKTPPKEDEAAVVEEAAKTPLPADKDPAEDGEEKKEEEPAAAAETVKAVPAAAEGSAEAPPAAEGQ